MVRMVTAMLSMCLWSQWPGSLPAEPHPQREAAWLGLVLSGAHWLWMCNLLAWGHRALGG